MGYLLGVDLGTTFSAAAVVSDGRVSSAGLGNQSHVVPSVVALDEEGNVVVGESAARQSRVDPAASAREFKRRFGDTTPYLLRGTPFSPEALTGRLLRWIVGRVAEIEGSQPDGIRLTHPANWGQYQIDLLGEAARLVDLGPVSFMTEPEAAAVHYATLQRIPDGAIVAVYDLGGGTFDASVLRREGEGFRTLGKPEGIARLGGIDFDEAVFGYVSRSLGEAWNTIDASDPATLIALARLRRDCVAAKEDLSSRTTTSVEVLLPGLTTEVRLTRTEFEGLITLPIDETIGALGRALTAAQVTPEDVHNVLLVGGSSRVPLVAQMVSSRLERPVSVDAHPKYAVSMGAAIALEVSEASPSAPTPVVEVAPVDDEQLASLFETGQVAKVTVADAVGPDVTEPFAAESARFDANVAEEALRVPLPSPQPVVPASQVEQRAPVSTEDREPDPISATTPAVVRAPFPSTNQITVLLVIGALALAAGLVWVFLVNSNDGGVPADDVAAPTIHGD